MRIIVKAFVMSAWAVCAYGALSVFALQSAQADIKIAVVDMQMVMTESSAAVSIQEQVQNEREKLQSEFLSYEDSLRESERLLVEKRSSMTAEEFAAKRDEFQMSLQETGSLVQKKRTVLENALMTATSKLRSEALSIIAGVAEDQGYDLVLTRQNIVLVAKQYDITDEVMERINSRLKHIALEMTDE
ncbi:MAG: OmpH family outer membrane protein [Alphaproteobacteria bacterium]